METIVFNIILGLYIFTGLIAIVGCMVSYFVSPRAFKTFDNMFFIIWVLTLLLIFIVVIVYCAIMALMLILGGL